MAQVAGDIFEARRGETLDALVWRTTGGEATALVATLEANPGLAARGARLPEGLQVFIPAAAQAPATAPLLQLWDD